jgi:hypothetical protein
LRETKKLAPQTKNSIIEENTFSLAMSTEKQKFVGFFIFYFFCFLSKTIAF